MCSSGATLWACPGLRTWHGRPQQFEQDGPGVLVVDTVGQFSGMTGDEENCSAAALEVLAPLQEVAAQGHAVIVVRHERKGGGVVGEAGRGSSAFTGAADIVVSIRRPKERAPSTRRGAALP